MSVTEIAPARPSELAEARRTMEICNACRYCEGYCPVFPAMTLRRSFSDGDLGYLANLCHNCKGCWHACQYAPPHEFGLNLPASFARLRVETYADHAWPAGAGQLFARGGLFVSLALIVAFSAVMLATMLLVDGTVLTGVHRGPGSFYAVIPYEVMVTLGTLTFGWAVIAMAIGVSKFWRASGGGSLTLTAVMGALRDAATTRHLGGGGAGGCNDADDRYAQGRRHFHMATMWGFLLCFAATSIATVMDHGLGWIAPYSWYSMPVVLGTVGGIGLLVGPPGLLWIKLKTDRGPEEPSLYGMETGFLALLWLTSATGLALLLFRHTSAMGGLLAVHLAVVLALFVTLPYGKFVHGLYRLAALVRAHTERPGLSRN